MVRADLQHVPLSPENFQEAFPIRPIPRVRGFELVEQFWQSFGQRSFSTAGIGQKVHHVSKGHIDDAEENSVFAQLIDKPYKRIAKPQPIL